MTTNEVDKIVEKLKKIYPYWWKWELMNIDPQIACQVLRKLNNESEYGLNPADIQNS